MFHTKMNNVKYIHFVNLKQCLFIREMKSTYLQSFYLYLNQSYLLKKKINFVNM